MIQPPANDDVKARKLLAEAATALENALSLAGLSAELHDCLREQRKELERQIDETVRVGEYVLKKLRKAVKP